MATRHQESWLKVLRANDPGQLERAYARTLFLDLDEYVVTRTGSTIGAALAVAGALEGGVATWDLPQWTLIWRTFGTGGWKERPSVGSVLTNFMQRTEQCQGDRAMGGNEDGIKHPFRLQLGQYVSGMQGFTIKDDVDNKYAHRACFDEHNKTYGHTLLAANPYLEKPFCDSKWLTAHRGWEGSNVHFCVGMYEFDQIHVLGANDLWINH